MKAKTLCMPVMAAVLAVTGSLATASTPADPTRPANTVLFFPNHAFEPASNVWVLNSTLVAAGRRVAVINGKHVSEGEAVGNATVVKIRNLDVVIQEAGKRITLKLLPDIVKYLP